MSPDELHAVAWDEMSDVLKELARDTMGLHERLDDDHPDHTVEDVEALQELINEGIEMFHEIWSMSL